MENCLLTLLTLTLAWCCGKAAYLEYHYIDPTCWQEEAPATGKNWPTEGLCNVACDLQNKAPDAPPCTGVRFDPVARQCYIGHIVCANVIKTRKGQTLYK